MSNKLIVIGSSVCFLVFLFSVWVVFTYPDVKNELDEMGSSGASLLFSNEPKVVCTLSEIPLLEDAPSLESFLKALTTEENRDLTFSGLAIVSKLTNACQPLVDVGKARVQVNKIALIAIKKDFATTCSLCELAVRAQHAGYSMVVLPFFPWMFETNCSVKTADKLLIPVVHGDRCQNPSDGTYSIEIEIIYSIFSAADLTNVHVRDSKASDDLETMATYLEKLYFWFLLGPIITLEWLRRKKMLCWGTTAPVDEESGKEEVVEESRGDCIQLGTSADNEGELRPLIGVTSNTRTDYDLKISNNMRILRIIVRIAKVFRRIIRYLPVGLVYLLLNLAALPVGISSGGLSFFRFDENEQKRQSNFWDVLLPKWLGPLISYIVTVFWPVVQISSFFMYSRFTCKRTWTVSTNPSKFIRSDWFSSNVYLLLLCVITPYCSFRSKKQLRDYLSDNWQFFYFSVCNVLCTVSNFLFVIILNKHKVVTRYVFYISVCMICAYVESDIVAVFYFILNSQGSLNNLKLTALRTGALGLTLTLSFSSSMHIIRKIMRPKESVFEGLSEK